MASGSFNLTRTGSTSSYITFKCNWSSVSNGTTANTSTVTINVVASKSSSSTSATYGTQSTTVSVDSTSQSNSGSFTLNPGATITLFSKTYLVSHNQDGTKQISINVNVGGNVMYAYGGANVTLDTIPRQATITNAPNFTDIQNPTITYSNPAGNSVSSLQACISLTGSAADISYRDIPINGNSYTFNLTEAERNVLRQATTTSNTRTVYFYIATVINGTTYRTNVGKTLTIVNANPTLSNITYQDTNSTTTAITQNNQIIIRNNSNLRVSLGTITALKYATLSSVSVTLNGVTKNATGISGTSVSNKNVNMGTVNLSQNGTASIVVTDSRGNTSTFTKEITIADWVQPTAIISLQRQNNYYTQTDINVDANYSSINGKNTITIQYQYKKTTDSNYSALSSLQDGVTTSFNIDNLYDWNVRVILTDKIGSTTYNLFVDKGIPIVFFDRLNSSVGVNCFPQNENSVEINGNTIFDMIYPVGSIYMSVNSTNPGTIFGGTWQQIQDTFLLAAGSTYSAGSTGGEATHTLTVNEMPSHQHFLVNYNTSGTPASYSDYGVTATSNVGYGGNVVTSPVGGGQAHNNMPPYLAVYVWKRTS